MNKVTKNEAKNKLTNIINKLGHLRHLDNNLDYIDFTAISRDIMKLSIIEKRA